MTNFHISLNKYCHVSGTQFGLPHGITYQKKHRHCYQLTEPIPDWRKDNPSSGTLLYDPLDLKLSQWNQRPFPIYQIPQCSCECKDININPLPQGDKKVQENSGSTTAYSWVIPAMSNCSFDSVTACVNFNLCQHHTILHLSLANQDTNAIQQKCS